MLPRALNFLGEEFLDFYSAAMETRIFSPSLPYPSLPFASLPFPSLSLPFQVNNEDQDSHLVIRFQELELKEEILSPYALKQLKDGGN